MYYDSHRVRSLRIKRLVLERISMMMMIIMTRQEDELDVI